MDEKKDSKAWFIHKGIEIVKGCFRPLKDIGIRKDHAKKLEECTEKKMKERLKDEK